MKHIPEPVRFCEDTALTLAERTFSSEVDEQLSEDIIRYARRLHTLYSAPQPAVQGELVGWVWHSYNQTNFTTGSHHKEVLEAEGIKLTPVYTAPKPAPDVGVLVEALSEARHYVVTSPDVVRGNFIQEIDDLIAAHHKGGEL